ncbi:MAG: hypothetical protein HYR92_05175, partial [Burkholderiales bacterium]|nr:hypothetical protein [Burkholderiales bacterium]
IRAVVAEKSFTLLNDVEVLRTCSVGFASFPFLPHQPHLLTWAQVVNFADQGLYMVKKSGRNACIGISHTDAQQGEDFYNRVMRNPKQAAQAQHIQLLADFQQEFTESIQAS